MPFGRHEGKLPGRKSCRPPRLRAFPAHGREAAASVFSVFPFGRLKKLAKSAQSCITCPCDSFNLPIDNRQRSLLMKWNALAAAPLAVCLLAGYAQAAPSVRLSGSNFTVSEAVNDDILAQIKQNEGKVRDMNKLSFELKKIHNEDLARICSLYPDMASLSVSDSKAVIDVSPVAALKKVTRLKLQVEASDLTPVSSLTQLTSLEVSDDAVDNVKWMSPLTNLTRVQVSGRKIASFEGLPSLPKLSNASLYNASADLSPIPEAFPNLTDLDLNYCNIKDLAPLTKLAKMKDLSLYGATVKDFSPLAGCPALKTVMYYATKGADYSTLGALKQVTELKGGLTKLEDISWVADMPNLKKFDVFAEYVKDYSPLGKISLERFQIWSMHAPVDLTEVGKLSSLKWLKLWSIKDGSNSKALSGLTGMEEVTIDEYNAKAGEPFDFSCASGWTNVAKAKISRLNGINTDGLGGMAKAENLDLSKINLTANAPFSLGFTKDLKALKSLYINEANLSDFDAVAGCDSLARVTLLKVKGVESLAALKKLPKLNKVIVSKGAFPDAELQGFAPSVKIEQR